jgi:hypothetical protein
MNSTTNLPISRNPPSMHSKSIRSRSKMEMDIVTLCPEAREEEEGAREGIDVEREGIEVDREGIEVDLEGIEVDREGIEVEREGMEVELVNIDVDPVGNEDVPGGCGCGGWRSRWHRRSRWRLRKHAVVCEEVAHGGIADVVG